MPENKTMDFSGGAFGLSGVFYIIEFKMKDYGLFSQELHFNSIVYAINALPEKSITYTGLCCYFC